MHTTESLYNTIRNRLDDQVSDAMISPERIYEALDLAQKEFARRTFCLADATSLKFTFDAGLLWLDVPKRVVKLRQLVTTTGSLILPTTTRALEGGQVVSDYGMRVAENWRTLEGTPLWVVTDLERYRWRLVPIPKAADQGTIECFRLPKDLTETAQPEIDDEWRPILIAGALATLYGDQNTETYDPNERSFWEQQFNTGVFRATSEIERARRGPGTGRFNKSGVW